MTQRWELINFRAKQTSAEKTKLLLTLKTSVPKRFATETFVILYSVNYDGPTKYVCKNEDVGLLQA